MLTNMRYIFFILLVCLLACTKNEFTLEFDLDKGVTNNFNVNYYATDKSGGKTIQAVASVREGKCILTGVTRFPTLVYISYRNRGIPLVVYADRGDKILISGSGDNPIDWNTEGGIYNAQLSEWRKSSPETLLEANPDSVNSLVSRYVENNSENPVALIILHSYFDRKINERAYQKLMASLHGEAKNTSWLKLTSRSDQLYHSYSYPARLESMVMRSDRKITDTLSIDKKNPVMLLFWHNGYPDRNALVDSLKNVTKSLPDSVILIADICADSDSVTWKSNIRRDSLEKVKRFWLPMGLNDPTAIKLHVTSSPYYIVFDKEGVQSYRGTDISMAIDEYKALIEATKKK